MAFDTPATIAVIGAGPIGLEASLYARFLGYQVHLLEQDRVGGHVRQWGHVHMFSPFAMNSSPLALAALEAQDETYEPPAPDAVLTGDEWVDRYLAPLAATDLLSDSLREECRVIAISRQSLLKEDAVGEEGRRESPFRLLVDQAGEEEELTADIVIDASGVFSQPRPLGPGGAWALGERALGDRICRGLPDVTGQQRSRFAGRHTLVVGAGYSAATTVAGLTTLRAEAPGTRITWAVRRTGPTPVVRIPDDRLPARDEVAAAANDAAAGEHVDLRQGVWVTELREADERIEVTLSDGQKLLVDEIVSHVGFRVDAELHRELQVHQCYASEGPMKLAAKLLGAAGADCLDQASHGADSLRTPEPDFYLLGAKSYGRDSQFLVSVGLRQIVDLFALIGDRAELDLYRGAPSLPQ